MTEGGSPENVAEQLSAAYAHASGLLWSEQAVSSALARITALAADVIPESSGSGISLLDSAGQRTTSAATDRLVEAADALQYGLEQGPCLTAWNDHLLIRVDNVARDLRWPQWASRATELGIASVLSAPLVAGGDTLGALKVYSSRPHAYTEVSEDLLRRFAELISILLMQLQTAQSAQQFSDDLKDALQSRELIAFARGILMVREQVDADRAYLRLIELADRRRMPIRAVAAEIVASTARNAEVGHGSP
ncbi:GAF domain-containing protein [Nocardia suismassiliense]|uniref:GAF domain-containing protein n=1 Tax=Nocardia suismassiliense TaxID=2077092 RepID=A0ABW6R4C1_9NOCA